MKQAAKYLLQTSSPLGASHEAPGLKTMKANQKFIRGNDDGVSPVIAVILMVAITVVLAATVYVWVSGFNTGNSSTRSISLVSDGPIGDSGATKSYVVASASPGLKWNEIDVTLDGASLTYTAPVAGDDQYCIATSGSTCAGTEPTSLVTAGQQLQLRDTGLSGQTLRVLDTASNAVIATIVVS